MHNRTADLSCLEVHHINISLLSLQLCQQLKNVEILGGKTVSRKERSCCQVMRKKDRTADIWKEGEQLLLGRRDSSCYWEGRRAAGTGKEGHSYRLEQLGPLDDHGVEEEDGEVLRH